MRYDQWPNKSRCSERRRDVAVAPPAHRFSHELPSVVSVSQEDRRRGSAGAVDCCRDSAVDELPTERLRPYFRRYLSEHRNEIEQAG